MEGLIDVRIDTNANNHIVHRGSIAFKQRELLNANGRTILSRAFDLERIMDDIDAFMTDYRRGNCKFASAARLQRTGFLVGIRMIQHLNFKSFFSRFS